MSRPLLAAAFALVAAAGTRPALGQAGAGAPFGARDPRTCASRNAPAHGAPTPAQIAQYIQCEHEKVLGSQLYLLEQVQVTGVGTGRPYNRFEDRNMGDIDVRAPVYPIRGSYVKYSCSEIHPTNYAPSSHAGTNCSVYEHPHATGLCNTDTFGDWHCYMDDPRAPDARPGSAAPR